MRNIGLAVILLICFAYAQFNNPAGVDIWCGKAYRATNASFNPGGHFVEPTISTSPLLNLKIAPRYSIYLEDEKTASVLVNASISYLVGAAYTPNAIGPVDEISLAFTLSLNGQALSTKTSEVIIGELLEVPIDLTSIVAQLEPYNLTIVAVYGDDMSYTASSEILKLPLPSDETTSTRIDNLYGGLSYRRAKSTEWMKIFPYTYYTQWTLYWNTSTSTLEEFSAMGYNMIHIVPTGDLGNSPFPWDVFQPYLDKAAELGLFFQYDVLFQPTNFTNMIEQVDRLKTHPSILLWYIADEPDGKSNPINATRLGYEQIRALDKYHPVSEALNCYDFYYEDYASGAEIILSDVYPISTNTSFSTVYNTTCNATYGCCGCDDCHGSFKDVSDRLDWFTHMDDVIGWQKTQWGVPQAFGNETFWTRFPTAAEEVVMTMLYINHGAKGIVMWDYVVNADQNLTPLEIVQVTNKLATVFTNRTVSDFFISETIHQTLEYGGAADIDAAAWVGEQYVLASIINLAYANVAGDITVYLPDGVDVLAGVENVWGEAVWTTSGGIVSTDGLMGLETTLLILKRVIA